MQEKVDWRTARKYHNMAATEGDTQDMNDWQDYLDIHFDYGDLYYDDDYDYDHYRASYDAESIYEGEE